MKLSHKITYLMLNWFSLIVRKSPNFIRTLFARLFYSIMFYIVPIRKELYLSNLKFAFPNKKNDWYINTAQRGYQFFMDRLIQFFAFPNSFQDLEIKIKNINILDDALTLKKGVVFVSGHFGAWEILSAWLTSNNYPITAVASKQKNRGSNKFFIEKINKDPTFTSILVTNKGKDFVVTEYFIHIIQ